MYITEPCVAFGLMAKSRKAASREKKIYKYKIHNRAIYLRKNKTRLT